MALDGAVRDAFASAAVVLPWLDERMDRGLPMCAYAIIVDPKEGAVASPTRRIRSGFALFPTADDIARLNSEFHTISAALADPASVSLLTSRRTQANPAVQLSLCTGRATRGGDDVALSDREFSVLATLALARRTLGREEFCDKLWPDRDSESAARLLKVYIHRIRTRFGTATVIDTRGGGYQLGEGVGVDVLEAERIVRAADTSSWLLDQEQRLLLERALVGIGARGYRRLEVLDSFAEIERRFVTASFDFARTLVDDALAEEDAPRALAIANEFAAFDPSDECAAELLIRTQLRLGRREAASQTFRSFCRTLRTAFDLPPPQHLSSLLQA
ncbi:MAG TPA: winged helix-turn-helix domain-containing protein [Candidatus Lustribacter sp.]|nr:winged helix-turn-helix domain-containing protein [Candidatus Lustribacter sp.]